MTIFAILNTNKNPNEFGFQVDTSVFKMLKDLLKQRFNSNAQLYFWKEVYLASQTNTRFKSTDKEWKQGYLEIDPLLQKSISVPIKDNLFLQKWKYNFISTFPRLFNTYLKTRRKFS